MPPGSVTYTLVGFAQELDWRPLIFVKRIPAHWVCNTCGLVRNWVAVLPCLHTLCESCYELSERDGCHVCPLDSEPCEDGDGDLREIPAQELLKREVKCWNEGNGCQAVLPASRIVQHYQRECRHHSIQCPRCSGTVLCLEVCEHLESECSTDATSSEPKCQVNSSRKEETAHLTSFRAILEEQAGELKALMERLLAASGANSDRLTEICHGINNSQETLREELRSVKDTVRQEVELIAELRGWVKKCPDEITAFREESKERSIERRDAIQGIGNKIGLVETLLREEFSKDARQKRDNDPQTAGGAEDTSKLAEIKNTIDRVIKPLLNQADLVASECKFVVKVVSSLLEQSCKRGQRLYEGDRVYLRGYCISPVVLINGGGWLSPNLYLHKGVFDDILQWPLTPTIRLTAFHPKGGSRVTMRARCTPMYRVLKDRHGNGQYVATKDWLGEYLHITNLISDGYVENDQLLVKFELLSNLIKA